MSAAGGVSIGVDVGGTFTDLVAVDRHGRVRVEKVLTTPDDRSRGVLAAVAECRTETDAVQRFVHGTTVVTNLLLERRGTRVVLITTAGFEDLLWLRRQERASLYDLSAQHPPPLVAREDVIGVVERVAPAWMDGDTLQAVATGTVVVTPLTDAAVQDVVEQAVRSGASSFAIALLHGHAYPEHERRLQHAVRDTLHARVPHLSIACSHEVLPEIREYERTATTVAEAYARPALTNYLRSLSDALTSRGFPAPRVMTSSGGTLPVAAAESQAASLALSGPAAGITAAAALARSLGRPDALTIDIGGTSADVGLVVDGVPLIERGGAVAGIPVALPRVLVETVAAGGGSIARVDAGGALQVGPESAGASPGPACYNHGGTEVTVTDAHVVLGHIQPGRFSAGVSIDLTCAITAVQGLATTLGRSVQETAAAIIATADATMARALRRVSVERGRDPRELVLIAFGGGGPLHACGLADMLQMTQLFVPPSAGVLSALGLALAPERRDGLAHVMSRLDQLTSEALQQSRAALCTSLSNSNSNSNSNSGDEEQCWARMRYVGQGHALDIPLRPDDSLETLAQSFASLHVEQFGYTLELLPEVVGLRASRTGDWWPLLSTRVAREETVPFEGVDDGLALEAHVIGPAVIALPDATLRVGHGWTADALPTGGWWLQRASDSGAVT